MKRLFDITLASFLLIILALQMLVIGLLIKLTSRGPVLHWSSRIGVNNTIFKMAKFRTMKINSPQVATHLLENPGIFLTGIGYFLRRSSIDELPQLFNIIKGEMSFVGPRPALFNQDDLKELRAGKNIHQLVPGVTGWAQVNGRDELPIPVKVGLDEYYLRHRSFVLDLKIIFLTLIKVIKREGIRH